MDPEFWLNKWSSNQIGFHEASVHNLLKNWWPSLGGRTDNSVFVPLCGKSLDLLWLRERHDSVVGVEISEIAAVSFFEEHDLNFTRAELGSYSIFSSDGIQIYCGDIFRIPLSEFPTFDLVYDRASLVALSPPDRIRYENILTKITVRGSKILLITVDYNPKIVSPPPHILTKTLLNEVYAPNWKIKTLDSQVSDVKGTDGREDCYQIERK